MRAEAHAPIEEPRHERVAHRQQRRLYELDVLRFLAAFAVVLYHYTGSPPKADTSGFREFHEMTRFTRYAYLGVNLFFIISGFVILMSIWNRRLGDFAVSRVVRLMPAYWFSIVLAGVAIVVTGHATAAGVRLWDLVPNLTMLQGGIAVPHADGAYWTLWWELRFYMLVALLIPLGVTYRNCILFMAAWTFLGIVAKASDTTWLDVMFMPYRSMYFIAGMAFFLIHRFGSDLLLWLFVLLSWALAVDQTRVSAGDWAQWQGSWDVPITTACVTVFFIVMALVATGRLGWLGSPKIVILGALTYPLYLLHGSVAHLLLMNGLIDRIEPWAALGTTVAVAVALSYLVHRFVEEPGGAALHRELKKSLARVRTTATSTPSRPIPRSPAQPKSPTP
ncbi:acyltransferase [Embleya sp. NPDC005575]|uniref:acyltransferase family protein n=1 Tax=Embleya sp. NPDC005575 TaxID=3156892 RepID=UPI0033BE4035